MLCVLAPHDRAISYWTVDDNEKLAGHAFISYVREDSHRVDQLQLALQAAGIQVWRDTTSLRPGQDWRVNIRRAITDGALVFIVCFSQAGLSRATSYQNEELLLAVEQLRLRSAGDAWLIPVRFDDCVIPDLDLGGGRTLASIQRSDLFGADIADGTARLVSAVLQILRHDPGTPASMGAQSAPPTGLPDRADIERPQSDHVVQSIAARLSQSQIRVMEESIVKAAEPHAVSEGLSASDLSAKTGPSADFQAEAKADTTEGIAVVVHAAIAAVGLAAALGSLIWPFLRVPALVALAISLVTFLYRRRVTRTWRSKSVIVTIGVCIISCLVLAVTFLLPIDGRLTGHSADGRREDRPSKDSQTRFKQGTSGQVKPGASRRASRRQITARGAAHLEADQVSISTRAITPKSPCCTLPPFRIDIRLLNTGDQVAAVNDARIVIQKFVSLPQCASQGGFGSTGTYGSILPTRPSPSQVVDIPISQLVPAGGADRFDLLLRSSPRARVNPPSIYLYRVRIYLTYNVDVKPVDLGEVLISLPVDPIPGEYYWTSYYAHHQKSVAEALYPETVATYKRCAIKNSRALSSILSLPAMRTAELTAMLPQLSY
jgi:hypothetical protein